MKYVFALLLFFCSSVFAQVVVEKSIDPPKPELHGSESGPILESLTPEEITFVKDQFKSATCIAALNEIVQPATDRGAVTFINHPESNAVVKLVAERVFGDIKKMNDAIYDDVYKEADAGNKGVRIWNVSAERVFIYKRMIEKVGSDQKLLTDLVAAIKSTEKK